MRVARVMVAVVAGCALSSGAAAAEPTGAIKTRGFPNNPTLAGERTLWMEQAKGGAAKLWAGAPRQTPERVQRFGPGFRGARALVIPRLAASPSLALLSTFVYDDLGRGFGFEPVFSDHHLGPSGERLGRIVRCPGEEETLRSADVWGEAYVYRQCDDSGGHVEIRDNSQVPLSPARSVGEGGFGARIAGRFVAWLERYTTAILGSTAEIVVYDRVTAAEAYRVRRDEDPGTIYSLDVQDDGKVAFSYVSPKAGTRRMHVAWASQEEPYPHRVSLPERGGYSVRMARDRVAFQGGRSSNSIVPHAFVGIARLSGQVRLVARRTDAHVLGDESFDYDGERFAWRELGCERRRLVIRAADARGTAPGADRNCRLRLLRRPVVRRGVATFHFSCGAFPTPCAFHPSLRTLGRRSRKAGGFRHGVRNPVRVRLTKPARRLLEKRGSLRVRAKVWLTSAGAYEQLRRATIRLRAE